MQNVGSRKRRREKRVIKKLLLFIMIFAFIPASYAESSAALTIDGQTVSFTEAYIYIVNAEQEYADVAKYYEDYLDIDYWSLTYANGMTVSQMIKSDVFDQIKSMNAFYAIALENGLSLTDAERASCRTDAENAYQALSVTDAEKIDIDDLSYVFEKQLLADRMYSVFLENMLIDEKEIRSSIDPKGYTVYDIEYLFRTFDDFDESGKSTPLTEDKQALIEKAFSEAQNCPSFSDAPNHYPALDIIYGTTSFLSADETVDPVLIQAAQSLAIGETSGILKTDFGLFLIRLIDNTSLKAYEQAVQTALYEAREAAFASEKESILKKCEYEINVPFWNTLAPGVKN